MADIAQGNLQSNGDFRPTLLPAGAVIASGVTGTLVTIPAPANGKVRLVSLSSNGDQTGISIIVDGVTIASNRTLALPNTSDPTRLVIGQASPVAIPYVEALTSIVISKDAGNTTASINYVAVEGV